ncbi:MAG: hypothetical protein FJ403_20025 [Verrucomicrobia bacterium]|nr:hypothetical protein [Verrucomicrobiota bacterium]
MTDHLSFRAYRERLFAFIARHANALRANAHDASAEVSAQFDALARTLFALQFHHVLPFRQFCKARGKTPDEVAGWREIPAMPAAAFKEFDLTSLSAAQRTTAFHSSGTTQQRPSRHYHSAESLQLYEASLLPWFKTHVVPELSARTAVTPGSSTPATERSSFLILTPPPPEAPHSSLVHMFESVRRVFGAPDSLFVGTTDSTGSWLLNNDAALSALRQSIDQSRPRVLLGTAFSFVHLLDVLGEERIFLQLPAGSRLVETGGYKGRSRALSKSEFHAMITEYLGIPPTCIVSEYGMSELSSQAYDRVAGEKAIGGCLQFPPWARVQIISPETGAAVDDNEIGLIRVFDLANVYSVFAVETEDLGIRRGDRLELVGRAAHAEAKGCSLLNLEIADGR